MKPTFTSHIVRKIFSAVGNNSEVDSRGITSAVFPDPKLDCFRQNYMAYNLSRKLILSDDDEAKRNASLKTFLSVEDRMADRETIDLTGIDPIFARVILTAQQWIADTLGECDGSWTSECEFTSGASTSRKRSEAHPAFKYDVSIVPDVTPLALPYLLAYVAQAPEAHRCAISMPGCYTWGMGQYETSNECFYRLVPGGILHFVEKDWKVKRPILAEPDWNMFLQKGVGNYIRRRLKTAGLNLNSQKLNQVYAFAGSISGSLGTIDLKSASDSISKGVCRLLLPSEWYEVLYALRSPCYKLDNEWFPLRKMCTMGNGYTFELESMLFQALAHACVKVLGPTDRRTTVFGDDIIVASSVCGYLVYVLQKLGFETNTEKSFWGAVPFRESCGKHYRYGIDCTPVYIKDDISEPFYRQKLINQLCIWDDFPNGVLNEEIRWLASSLPREYKNQIPLVVDDDGNIVVTGGLHDASLCADLVRLRRGKLTRNLQVPYYGTSFEWFEWTHAIHDDTDRYAEGSLWLFMHMTGYSAPEGVRKVTSEQGLVRVRKVAPCARTVG